MAHRNKNKDSHLPPPSKKQVVSNRDRVSPLKQERIARQREREAANRVSRKYGELTPWEIAKEERRQRRSNLRAKGMLPTQPRNADGFIVKHLVIDGTPQTRLVICCKRCLIAAQVENMDSRDWDANKPIKTSPRKRVKK